MDRGLGNHIRMLASAGVALVVMTGCSGGASGSASLAVPATTTSTASAASSTSTTTSTTSAPATTATTRPAPSTTAPPAAQPERVVASPGGAAPEARVSLSGSGFAAEHWRASGGQLWLAGSGPSGCDFFAQATHDVRVTADGRLSGTFVVPSSGDCRQGSLADVPITAGRYRIVYQCTACTIGEFHVTASAPNAGTPCQNVGFTPNSDNLASEIVAYGLPCSEAEALVRKVGGPLGPINGAPTAEADGFVCVRTGQQEGRGLPSATYECTRGGQRITFTRT